MRTLSTALVAAAVVAGAAGTSHAAWYLLVAAIPAIFTAGLGVFGDFVDGDSPAPDVDLMRLALFACALAFVLAGAVAARAALASSTAAVCALALEAVLAVAPPAALVVLRGRR